MKINEIINYKPKSPDEEFHAVFLSEMPHHAPGHNDFDIQLYALKINIDNNTGITTKLSDNFFEFNEVDTLTYWVGSEDLSEVRIIVSTKRYEGFCKVQMASKNPEFTTPYASEVYQKISDHLGGRLAFSSDDTLSTEAIKLWKGMITRGKAISVFDTHSGKFELEYVKTADELSQYFGEADKKRYVFVLHSTKAHQNSAHYSAKLMEMKRKNFGKPYEDSIRNPWKIN